jgi:hypothetical protein
MDAEALQARSVEEEAEARRKRKRNLKKNREKEKRTMQGKRCRRLQSTKAAALSAARTTQQLALHKESGHLQDWI